jgi:hypothetical protein
MIRASSLFRLGWTMTLHRIVRIDLTYGDRLRPPCLILLSIDFIHSRHAYLTVIVSTWRTSPLPSTLASTTSSSAWSRSGTTTSLPSLSASSSTPIRTRTETSNTLSIVLTPPTTATTPKPPSKRRPTGSRGRSACGQSSA